MHAIPPAPPRPARTPSLAHAISPRTPTTVTPRLALKITRAVALVRRLGTAVRFYWCFHCTDHVDRVGVQPRHRHQGRPPAPVSTTRGKDNHHTYASSLTTTRAPFPALTSVTFTSPNINVPSPNVDVDASPLICQLLLEFWQSSTRYDDDDDYGDRDDQSSTPTLSVL